ncbi:MAG: hypothetical protein AB7S26_42265 [Sandaracinaceae bacterium]
MRISRRSLPALLSLGALTAAAVVVVAPRSSAQDAPAQEQSPQERFNGTWRYNGSASHGRNIIEQAITRAVDGMNFITQPIATGRLRDKNPLVQRIEVALTTSDCRVVFDGSRTYRAPLNTWTEHRFDGDTFQVEFRHRDDSIVQLFRSDGGTRRNVYRLLPDGHMRLEVTVQSGSLPRSMSYRLTYRR